MKKYIIVIEKAANNFSAFCPDVPGCVATGSTVEETAANMKDALEFHLEDETFYPVPHDFQIIWNEVVLENLADEFYFSMVSVSLPQNA